MALHARARVPDDGDEDQEHKDRERDGCLAVDGREAVAGRDGIGRDRVLGKDVGDGRGGVVRIVRIVDPGAEQDKVVR